MDREEKKLYQQEINWRDQKIQKQKDYIFQLRHKETKPKNWPMIGFFIFVFVIVSFLPG